MKTYSVDSQKMVELFHHVNCSLFKFLLKKFAISCMVILRNHQMHLPYETSLLFTIN